MMDNMAVSGVLDSTTGLHMEQLQVDAEGAKLSMQVCSILCLLLRCYKNEGSAETLALIPEMLAVSTKFVCENAAGSVVETLWSVSYKSWAMHSFRLVCKGMSTLYMSCVSYQALNCPGHTKFAGDWPRILRD